MFKVSIKKQNVITNQGKFETEIEAQEWINYHVENNSWGKKAWTEVIHAVVDEQGNELEAAKEIQHAAEYEVEILDITAEVEAEKTKQDKKKKDRENRVTELKKIDWKNINTVAELKQVVKFLYEEALKDD